MATAQVICGDVIDVLDSMPTASVHTIITSPPYYGLRDYGIPPRRWADGSECVLGLEPTLGLYLVHLTEVFQHAKRVLRPEGTLWLNLGDSYAGGGRHDEPTIYKAAEGGHKPVRAKQRTLTGKDLLMVPAQAALSLQCDGWVLRQDIIWSKGLSFCPTYSGSVMPESTTDRPTWAHEHIFLLAQGVRYYYDQNGCKEPYAASTVKQTAGRAYAGRGQKDYAGAGAQNPSDVKRRVIEAAKTGTGRNLRNVWVVPKKSYLGFHFATFNPDLVDPMIRLATSEHGCCPTCGTQWTRKVIKEALPPDIKAAFDAARGASAGRTGRDDGHTQRKPNFVRKVLGETWLCNCEHEELTPVPATVMDLFSGSARCGIAAVKLGRNYIGIDVNPDYCVMGVAALREAGAEIV